eukprot:TRINITY_DN5144_c0_g1_i1.p1 TRINITY_DN5144_c0_g1~~TRINITY_DN5144_c0_g1_i1.p1  ORF type:complete len:231 (-),score=53.34 TRINITY_DN5144_c0_g1_i1:57-749(-)
MIVNATENMLEGYQITQFTLTLGNGSVNPALEQAILTMNLGERADFLIDQKYFPQYETEKPVQYSLEIIRFGKPVNSPWKYNVDERYQAGVLMKNKGNELIKTQNYENAQQCYQKANKLVWQDTGKIMEPLQVAIKSNLILTNIKTGNNERASELADKILEKDPTNIKIMLRKAVAQENLAEFKEAKKTLEIALQIEPNNQEVIKEINSLKEKQATSIKKEKKVQSKMIK